MHCWLKTLPVRPLQTKVYLDDRGLLDPDPRVLETVITATRLFDFAFGFDINLQKSVRMAVHSPKRLFRNCVNLQSLPNVTWTRYLGSSVETKACVGMDLGKQRAKKTVAQLERTRLLPVNAIREQLACAHVQAMYPQGSLIPVKACDTVRSAMVRAVWGPNIEPNT